MTSNLALTIGLNQILHDRRGYEKYVGFVMPYLDESLTSESQKSVSISDIKLDLEIDNHTCVVASKYIESVKCLSEIDLDFTREYDGNPIYHKRKLSYTPDKRKLSYTPDYISTENEDESSISPGFYIDEKKTDYTSIEEIQAIEETTITSISESTQNRMHLYVVNKTPTEGSTNNISSDSKSISWGIGELFKPDSIKTISVSPSIEWEKITGLFQPDSKLQDILLQTAILCNTISTYSNANIAFKYSGNTTHTVVPDDTNIVNDIITDYTNLINKDTISLFFEQDNDGITPLHLFSSCSIDGASKKVSDAYQSALLHILTTAHSADVLKQDSYGNTFLHNLFSVNPSFCKYYVESSYGSSGNEDTINNEHTLNNEHTINNELIKIISNNSLFKIKNNNGLTPFLSPVVSFHNRWVEHARDSREYRNSNTRWIIALLCDALENNEDNKKDILVLKGNYNNNEIQNIIDNTRKNLPTIRHDNNAGYCENYTLWMPSQSDIKTIVNTTSLFPLYIRGCIFKGVPTEQKSDYTISNTEVDTSNMQGPISTIDNTTINSTAKLMEKCMQTFKNTNAVLALSKIFTSIKNKDEPLPSKQEYEKLDKDRKAEFVFVINNNRESGYEIELFISG